MFKIGNQGTFETLPDHAMAIYKGDVTGVEEFIKQGMELEKVITLSKYIALTPLDIALITNQQAVVKLLVERGVNLNVKTTRQSSRRSDMEGKRLSDICTRRVPS